MDLRLLSLDEVKQSITMIQAIEQRILKKVESLKSEESEKKPHEIKGLS